MKNLKKDDHGRDAIYWLVAIFIYTVGCAVYFGVAILLIEFLNVYWGILVITPVMGFIIPAPLLAYQEIYVERKYRKEQEARAKRRERRLSEIKAQAEKGFY